ncbi:MAG: hypothetical protein ABEI52_09885 [Halobacteriaceae archaeon]
MGSAGTTFEMGLREYARMPVLLALLLFLPAYFIMVFTNVMPAQQIGVDVPVQGVMHLDMRAVIPVAMTPMATAFIGGIAGLFLMQSARKVDRRLSLVGAGIPEILSARFGVLGIVTLVASIVSMCVLMFTYVPELGLWFLLATVIVGLMYGGIGMLIGLVLNRLAGVYVIMFGPLLDLFLAQSPLSTETPDVAPYLPGYYPMQLAFDAAFTSRVEMGNFWFGLGYLSFILLIAGTAFYGKINRA